MLSEKDIKKFQGIYKKEFGKEISKQEASEQGAKVVNLMKIILKHDGKTSKTIEPQKDKI